LPFQLSSNRAAGKRMQGRSGHWADCWPHCRGCHICEEPQYDHGHVIVLVMKTNRFCSAPLRTLLFLSPGPDPGSPNGRRRPRHRRPPRQGRGRQQRRSILSWPCLRRRSDGPKDPSKAFVWLSLAAEKRVEKAKTSASSWRRCLPTSLMPQDSDWTNAAVPLPVLSPSVQAEGPAASTEELPAALQQEIASLRIEKAEFSDELAAERKGGGRSQEGDRGRRTTRPASGSPI